MLNRKLQAAEQHNAKKSRHMVVLLSVIAVLCAILVIAVSTVSFSSGPRQEVENRPALEVPVAQASLDTLRDQFKDRLQTYENETEPAIESAYLNNWNREAVFEIGELKAKAIQHYAGGDYAQALRHLEMLEDKARSIFSLRKQLFDEHYQQAQLAYLQDNYEQALLAIEKALNIDPESGDALSLKSKIEKLADILPLLEQARIARAENNPAREFEVLSQVVQIDAERPEIIHRVAELDNMLQEIAFKESVSRAYAEMEKKNAASARESFEIARSVFPDREEIRILQREISVLENTLGLNTALTTATRFIEKDDWPKAREYFEKAAKYAPRNKDVIQGLARANHILQLKNAFSDYENNPYRLTNSNYREKVENDLALSRDLDDFSFSLKQQSDRVTLLIEAMNNSKDIVVVSDNQTFVQVRGVGKIGKTQNRIIQLKPGHYTFEGLREGYKSKLVKVLVPYDKSSINVTVVCDEPI